MLLKRLAFDVSQLKPGAHRADGCVLNPALEVNGAEMIAESFPPDADNLEE